MAATTVEGFTIEQAIADAVTAYRARNLGEAEALCRSILERHPDHIPTLQILGAIAAQSGAAPRGIQLLQKVVALQPALADGHIELAKLLRLDGQTQQAVATLERAIELEPSSAAAYNDLGLIHLAEIDVAEALRCFNRAIEISPQLAIAHYNKGLALERQGLFDEAIAAFRRVTALDATFAEAHAKLGNLLLTSDDRSAALDCFRHAAAVKPDSGLALMCEAKLLVEEERPGAAEEPARRAIQRDPQNSDAHCLLGSILMELGRFDDAAVVKFVMAPCVGVPEKPRSDRSPISISRNSTSTSRCRASRPMASRAPSLYARSSAETEQSATGKGVRPNHVGAAIARHKRAGRIEEHDGKPVFC
jgi:tetratricopeptide (TPR) repeat protein